jgi:LmbE family N-acetylglucosaminyl deacetylase
MVSVMAIGAHPDDVEVGCFGTLMKHKKKGDRVTVVITTKGGYGERSWETISKEMKRASSILGVEYVVLDNPIGHYGMTWKTVSELDALIKKWKVDTIYSVWHGDSHQDHRNTFQNILAACRAKMVKTLLCYELLDYSYRSQHAFEPRVFVDITDHLDSKLKAVRSYKSYFAGDFAQAVKGLAQHRGRACGVKYAEAFEIVFQMWK